MRQVATAGGPQRAPGRRLRGEEVARPKNSFDEEVLYGWKEIATFIGCSPRNAQRLEKNEGLPVLRPDKRQKWRVLALKRSLLAWMTGGVESVAISGNSLLAFNRKTRILWSHEFPHALRSNPEELSWRLRVVDLDGIGEKGVTFVARFESQSHPDTLVFFSPTGKVHWELDADPPLLDRRGQPFDRAWTYTHAVMVRTAKGIELWAAFANLAGWAGGIMRVRAGGSAAVQFANTGYVERLCPVSLPDGNFVIACGENNDYDDAFVALLGSADPPSCSPPGERLVYRFANAPTGHPRKYVLFPKTELIWAQSKPYGAATRIAEHADGVIVSVATADDGAYFLYHFSKDLEPRYVFPSGSHEFVHRQLEKSGAIPHAWPNCPELQSPLILRIWEPDSGWYERPISWRDNPWKEIESRER